LIPLISAQSGSQRRDRPGRGRLRRVLARASGAVGAALLVLALGGPPAQAHALLVRSDPVSGAVLAGSPSAITLWFDEEISPRVSTETCSRSGGVAAIQLATPASGWRLRVSDSTLVSSR